MSAFLELSRVETFYGAIQALKGVDITVNKGEIVTIIGSNGAGKSTLMMTICGNPQARRGTIRFKGEDITREQSQSHHAPQHRPLAGGAAHLRAHERVREPANGRKLCRPETFQR